ncbi:MAG: flagellar basal-body rod protein FlgG [Bacillota bacterium]
MLRALWTGATGMASQQLLIDTISNNLANVNTAGYKKQRVQFQDLYYETVAVGLGSTATLGSGSRVSATDRSFRQGNVERTDDPLSMAIEGQGFFAVETGSGTAYTRDGSFRLDASGRLCTATGYMVLGDGGIIEVPEGATEIEVTDEGIISGVVDGERQEIGSIGLVLFANPAGLEATGNNLYRATQLSGEPVDAVPGQDGAGLIRGGYIETSNVEIVTEMVNLIIAQRAFELNSKAVETADQMWGIANNVKR